MRVNSNDIINTLTDNGFIRVRNFREDLERGFIFNYRSGKSTIMQRKADNIVSVMALYHNTNTCDLFVYEESAIVGHYPNSDYRLWAEMTETEICEFFDRFTAKVVGKKSRSKQPVRF